MLPEIPLTRPCALARERPVPRSEIVVADAAECSALAAWLDIAGVDALRAEFAIDPVDGGFVLAGKVTATVRQACVVTGEDVATSLSLPVRRVLVWGGDTETVTAEGEVEVDADEADIEWLDGPLIDLGRVAAEEVSLGLPMAPRSQAADAALEAVEKAGEAVEGPFASLARLQ